MVGNDATIKIGSDVAGALAGIMSIQMGMKNLDKTVIATAALVKTSALIVTAALVGVGVAGAVGVKKATDNFREFEQAATNAASVGGEIGEEFIKVKENVMDMSKALGRETMFTADQSADAFWHIASAGYDVGTMVKEEFKPIMDLAAGTEMELARTTHWVASALSQFGLDMGDAARVADIYAITNGNTLATVEKLGLGMVYVGTQAAMYNDTIEDTTYLLGLMANRGLRGEQSGRGLAMAYRRLAVPTARAKKEIEKLGLTLEEVSPDHNTMIDILKKFEAAEMGATSATIIFGQEASKAVTAATGGLGNLELYNKIMNSTGFAAILAAEQLDTLKGTTRIFHSALEVLSIEIGEFSGYYLKGMNIKLIELVNVIIDKVEPTFIGLQKLLDDLSPTFTSIKKSAESIKGIFEDMSKAVGFSNESFDSLVNSLNIIAISISMVLRFIDKHSLIIKFGLAIAFAAAMFVVLIPTISAVLTAGGYLITLITGIGTALGITTTFLITGFMPAWVGAWLVALGPIALVAGAISLLTTAWIFDIGGMRDITKGVLEEIADIFFWIIDKMFWFVNKSIDLGNKLRKMAGKEPIEFQFDIEGARINMKRFFKQMELDIMYPEDAIGIEWLDSLQHSIDYIAQEGAEYEKSKAYMDSYNNSRREAIIILDDYTDAAERASRFDISGMSAEKAHRIMPRIGAFADVDVGRKAERIAEVRNTVVNIETVNTKAELDDLDKVFDEITRDAAESAGF